jgi:DNA-binding NarL/FixJ family response regulator
LALAPPLHVLVIDRYVLQREALAALITTKTGIHATSSGPTPAEVDAACVPLQADVALLALDRLDPDDQQSIRAIAARGLRIVVLTLSADPSAHAHAIESGAHGIVSREQSGEMLCEALRAVHRGDIWIERQGAPAVVSCLLRRQGARDLETMKIESLTRREREIVALITEGLRNRQIADRLCISEATVRNHVTSILSKLELTDRFDVAVYAFRRGMAKAALHETESATRQHVLVPPARRA